MNWLDRMRAAEVEVRQRKVAERRRAADEACRIALGLRRAGLVYAPREGGIRVDPYEAFTDSHGDTWLKIGLSDYRRWRLNGVHV